MFQTRQLAGPPLHTWQTQSQLQQLWHVWVNMSSTNCTTATHTQYKYTPIHPPTPSHTHTHTPGPVSLTLLQVIKLITRKVQKLICIINFLFARWADLCLVSHSEYSKWYAARQALPLGTEFKLPRGSLFKTKSSVSLEEILKSNVVVFSEYQLAPGNRANMCLNRRYLAIWRTLCVLTTYYFLLINCWANTLSLYSCTAHQLELPALQFLKPQMISS